jgi:Phytochelatin synthase
MLDQIPKVAVAETSRPLRRLVLLGFLAVFLFVLAWLAYFLGPLVFAANSYAHVPSIERRADYRVPRLMAEAWSLPVAKAYARAPYEFQENQSFCGPASVANLLHSLGIPGTQSTVLDGTAHEPWFGILIGGMTLDAVADLLATRLNRQVMVVRDPTLQQFRALMRTANNPRRRMIVNFHRGPMFGRGHGHFSPVLGYLSGRDLALVGDVNAEYRPYLTPIERLWRATDTRDADTGRERGLIIVDLVSAKL